MAKVTVKTRAVVLQSIKYGDSSLVVKMLTEELGVQSFMVKGVYGKKSKMKAAFFQNMTLLDIVAEIGNSSLGFIKEISLSHYYKTLSLDFKKTTILIFISELLSKSIAESEADTNLFNYIYDSMLWLDETESNYADFPILFAMKLSAYLGFFPNLDTYSEGSCFDLLDGNFKKGSGNDIYQLDAELSKAFYQLSAVSYQPSNISQIFSFSVSQFLRIRRQLLESVVTYYKLHSDNVKEIKSLEVLRTMFS